MLRTRLGAADDPHAEVWEGTEAEFEAGNKDHPDLIEAVRALLPGQKHRGGGGAAVPFTVERIDFTRETCLECSATGPHDDNGFAPSDLGYAVKCDCGFEWSPNED